MAVCREQASVQAAVDRKKRGHVKLVPAHALS
jgi:hypothetical protein